jgi:hypothetical protein
MMDLGKRVLQMTHAERERLLGQLQKDVMKRSEQDENTCGTSEAETEPDLDLLV